MNRLFCLLLAAVILFSLCACADKKGEEKTDPQSTAEETATKEETVTSEETKTTPEEIVKPATSEKPSEIGTLPIIFGDGDENKTSTTTKPSTTTKKSGTTTTSKPGTTTTTKPGTTTSKPSTSSNPLLGSGDGKVVETPIIPFN